MNPICSCEQGETASFFYLVKSGSLEASLYIYLYLYLYICDPILCEHCFFFSVNRARRPLSSTWSNRAASRPPYIFIYIYIYTYVTLSCVNIVSFFLRTGRDGLLFLLGQIGKSRGLLRLDDRRARPPSAFWARGPGALFINMFHLTN